MEFKDVTIGALGGIVAMFGPLIGLLGKIIKMYVRHELGEELDKRMIRYENSMEKRIALILRAELGIKNSEHD
jgi:hypothetical protein